MQNLLSGGLVTGRGCSDKGSEDIFEEDCETFQSKEKVSYDAVTGALK